MSVATLERLIARWDSDVLRRVAQRVTVSVDGCWIANFSRRGGYAMIDVAGKTRQVHCVVYEFAKGGVPGSLELDHLCRNRACCNPAHLEAVTRRINCLRGESPTAKHARKTHCPRGHALTPENCRPHKLGLGRRSCITCENTRARELRAERRNASSERNFA